MTEKSLIEKLLYSTLRIETFDKDGKLMGTGTSFIVDVGPPNTNNEMTPILITNKHVIKDAHKFTIRICLMDGDEVNDTKHSNIEFDLNSFNWVLHPDNAVDLCAIDFGKFVSEMQGMGLEPVYTGINISLLPDESTVKEEIDAAEDIYVVGYPNGIWDTTNNKPLLRKGVTATNYNLDYCSKKEFLIDCAIYPGSSGSPVFWISHYTSLPKRRRIEMQPKVYLVGIVYAVLQATNQGEIEIIDIPTKQIGIFNNTRDLNLGVVIKSERIRELAKLV